MLLSKSTIFSKSGESQIIPLNPIDLKIDLFH